MCVCVYMYTHTQTHTYTHTHKHTHTHRAEMQLFKTSMKGAAKEQRQAHEDGAAHVNSGKLFTDERSLLDKALKLDSSSQSSSSSSSSPPPPSPLASVTAAVLDAKPTNLISAESAVMR